MKTTLTILLFCCFFRPVCAKSQTELRYGFGAVLHVEALEKLSFYNGIVIHPKIVVPIEPEHAVSLGGAYTFCLNSNESYNNLLTLQFPILLDYNYGLGTSRQSQKKKGFFAGIGYQSVIYGLSEITTGIVLNTGFRLLDLTPNRIETTEAYRIEKEGFMRLYFPHDGAANQILAIGFQFNFPSYSANLP